MKLLPNYGWLALFAVWSYCAAVGTPMAYGQDTQYVSDRVLVPVRSGAGPDFRIVNSGLPSGTARKTRHGTPGTYDHASLSLRHYDARFRRNPR